MESQDKYNALTKLKELEKQGFVDQLKFEDDRLLNLSNKKKYSINQVKNCKEYRFEGMSNPSDNSILFAIGFDDNSKGTLTVAYGPDSDPKLFEFIKKITC
jgi:hypothetical protein